MSSPGGIKLSSMTDMETSADVGPNTTTDPLSLNAEEAVVADPTLEPNSLQARHLAITPGPQVRFGLHRYHIWEQSWKRPLILALLTLPIPIYALYTQMNSNTSSAPQDRRFPFEEPLATSQNITSALQELMSSPETRLSDDSREELDVLIASLHYTIPQTLKSMDSTVEIFQSTPYPICSAPPSAANSWQALTSILVMTEFPTMQTDFALQTLDKIHRYLRAEHELLYTCIGHSSDNMNSETGELCVEIEASLNKLSQLFRETETSKKAVLQARSFWRCIVVKGPGKEEGYSRNTPSIQNWPAFNRTAANAKMCRALTECGFFGHEKESKT